MLYFIELSQFSMEDLVQLKELRTQMDSSMAVQPQWAQKWDNQLAAYVAAGFRTTTIGTLANNGVSLVSKLVTVATIWLGAQLVIEGKMSVGQLIAFNM